MATPLFRWPLALLITLGIFLAVAASCWLAPADIRAPLGYLTCILAPLLTCAAIWPLAGRMPLSQETLAWRLLAFSALAFAGGYAHEAARVLLWQGQSAVQWGDAAFALGYLALWVGVLLRNGRLPIDLSGKMAFGSDLLIALAAALLIVVHSPNSLMPASTPALFNLIGYPVLLLITVFDLLVMSLRAIPGGRHAPQALFMIGVCTVVIGDTILAAQHTTVPNATASPWSALWILGFLLYTVAALWELNHYQETAKRSYLTAPFSSLAGQLMLVGLVTLALVSTIHRWLVSPPLSSNEQGQLVLGMALLVVLLMLRQVLGFVSTRHLYTHLQQQYMEVAWDASTDPLTGLANKRYFTSRLAKELRRAERYHRPLSLIFTDLDHFKHINDSYGHHIGDEALVAFAGCLCNGVRDTDTIARYGGEEFVILLPETSLAQATLLADRLRRAVQASSITTQQGPLSLTISCGVSAYPATADTIETLVANADQAMYEAKRQGRNRVITAPLTDTLPAR